METDKSKNTDWKNVFVATRCFSASRLTCHWTHWTWPWKGGADEPTCWTYAHACALWAHVSLADSENKFVGRLIRVPSHRPVVTSAYEPSGHMLVPGCCIRATFPLLLTQSVTVITGSFIWNAWTNDLQSGWNVSTDLTRDGGGRGTSWARCATYHCPRSTQGQGVFLRNVSLCYNNVKINHVSGMWD
jgi:hypothetical protein